MAGYIEDRWLTKKKDPVTGKRARTARYGKGSRYRVAGIPGVRDKSFDVLEDAKAWLRRAGTDSERGEFVDPRDGSITLDDYVTRFWQAGVRGAPGTVKRIDERVRLHIRPHLGTVSLRDITPAVLRGYIAALEGECAPRYARQIPGESVVTLARWLGHSTPTITPDFYAHFMPEAGGKGRSAIDALLNRSARVVTAG